MFIITSKLLSGKLKFNIYVQCFLPKNVFNPSPNERSFNRVRKSEFERVSVCLSMMKGEIIPIKITVY
jgi:hypothetical protein